MPRRVKPPRKPKAPKGGIRLDHGGVFGLGPGGLAGLSRNTKPAKPKPRKRRTRKKPG